MTDLARIRYLADSQDTPNYWRQYVFPNGRGANVSIDERPDSEFRFVVEYDAEHGLETEGGLSRSEVEAKLAEIAALPTA